MSVTDISELRRRRKAKQTRMTILRVFVVLLVCGAVLVAVFTKDIWFPSLKGILSAIPDQAISGSNESKGDTFPLKVEGGMGYQLDKLDNSLALLDDSRFHVYSTDGKLLYEKQHTFANPVLCVSENKALIYDEGGRVFSLESKYKTIYTKTADDVIYLASLSKSDYAAVVTKSDKFLAMLKIYDNNGNPLFTYYSYDSRIINVTFNDNSTGCVVTVLTAEGGVLVSKMIRFDFTDTEPKWVSDSVTTLALDVSFTSDGDIIMVGDTLAASFNSQGTLISQYEYADTITDFETDGDYTAILTTNSDVRKCELIMINETNCNNPMIIQTGEYSEHVIFENSQTYIFNVNTIAVFDLYGNSTGVVTLEDDYEDFCKCGRYLFLMGYDSINRIEFGG